MTTIAFDRMIDDLNDCKNGHIISHHNEWVSFSPSFDDDDGHTCVIVTGHDSGEMSIISTEHNDDKIELVGDDYHIKMAERGKVFDAVIRPMKIRK